MKYFNTSSLLFAALTAIIYFAMNRLNIDQRVKWWLFGFHLFFAGIGFLTALLAITKRQWLAVISLVICGYFLWLQLIG